MIKNSLKNSDDSFAKDKVFFKKVFLLTKNVGENILDRRVLQQADYHNILEESQGLKFAKVLAEQAFQILEKKKAPSSTEGISHSEIIICHTQLSDMNVWDFISLVRSHPLLISTPILVLLNQGEKVPKIDVEILERPFAASTISIAIQKVYGKCRAEEMKMKALGQGIYMNPIPEFFEEFENNIKNFDKVDSPINSLQAYKEGLYFVRIAEYSKAVKLLTIASSEKSAIMADALYALASVWRIQKDKNKEKLCLSSAFSAYFEEEAWAKARAVAEKLMVFEPPHPLIYGLERAAKAKQVFVVCNYINVGLGLFNSRQIAEVIASTEDNAFFLQGLKEFGYVEIAQELDAILKNLPEEKKDKNPSFSSIFKKKQKQESITKKGSKNDPNTLSTVSKNSLIEIIEDAPLEENFPVDDQETMVWGETKVEPLTNKEVTSFFGQMGAVIKGSYSLYKNRKGK